MNKVTLVIVDCQHDFIKGSLAVDGATDAVNNIIDYIIRNKKNIDNIIFTVDWHPYNHCSFKINGGQWPVHCVQFSRGATINESLLQLVHASCIPYTVAIKGNVASCEEYGAFTDTKAPILTGNDIVVCGIAGDYCVKETINNLILYSNVLPKVLLSGVASIDKGEAINKFIKERNLSIVK